MELVGGAARTVARKWETRGELSHITFSRFPHAGLIGLRTRLLNATQGTAVMHHRFEAYRPISGEVAGAGRNGVAGVDVAGQGRGLRGSMVLQERAEMFIAPGERSLRRDGRGKGKTAARETCPSIPRRKRS